MEKPDVDFIEGLSPAISIDQKSTSRNPRSTVGHDHRDLRLPPGALRARRPSALPQVRPPDRPADPRPDRRPGHASSRRARGSRCSRRRPRPQGRVREAPGGSRPRRGSRGRGSTARFATSRSRSGSRRPTSTRSRSSSTVWSPSRTSVGGWPTPSRPRWSCAEGLASIAVMTHEGHEDAPDVLPAARVHLRRALLRGARAAELLVQLPVRRVPDLRRPGDAARGRPRARGAGRRPVDREGAIAPWASATLEYWYRVLEAVAEADGLLARHPLEEAPQEAPATSCSSAPTNRSTSRTRTATAGSARTTPPSRA